MVPRGPAGLEPAIEDRDTRKYESQFEGDMSVRVGRASERERERERVRE